MVPGAFVRVLFHREKPHLPGLLHIGYVLGVTPTKSMVAYTTSQPWPTADSAAGRGTLVFARGGRAPEPVPRFPAAAGRARKPALTPDWFPDLDRGESGLIAVAPASLQAELVGFAANLARRRRELIQMRGP